MVKSILSLVESTTVFEYMCEDGEDGYTHIFTTASSTIYSFTSILDMGKCYESMAGLMKIVSSVNNTYYYHNGMDYSNTVPIHIYKESLILLGDTLIVMMDIYSNRPHSDNSIAGRITESALRFYETVMLFDTLNARVRVKLSRFYLLLSSRNIQSGDSVCAKTCLDKAATYNPENPIIYYNMGVLYTDIGDTEAALVSLKLAIVLSGVSGLDIEVNLKKKIVFASYYKIADILKNKKQYSNAIQVLKKVYLIDPENPDICNLLGLTYIHQNKYKIALDFISIGLRTHARTQSIEGIPYFISKLYSNSGLIHYYMGDNTMAIKCYTQSQNIFPITKTFQNLLLCNINIFNTLENKMDIKTLHCKINAEFEPLRKAQTQKYIFDPIYEGSRINIGIVTSDLNNHVVYAFISSYLTDFTYSEFSVTCYTNFNTPSSILPENKNMVIYKDISLKSATDAADEIHRDKIHILVDLNGHTADNRLDIFSLRPAPVQVTYMGYPFSTGLAEMDYRFTDAICDNAIMSQVLYNEKLVFMKDCFLCFNSDAFCKNPDGSYIDIRPAPYTQNRDFLKIGCFSRPDKLTDETLEFFQTIIRENSRVKLVFKFRGLDILENKETFIRKFDPALHPQITFINYTTTHSQHIDKYNDVDISIDTFPYSGTTTCCDSLFMGTPMFTLYDSRFYFHAHNVSSSIIRNTHPDMQYFVLESKDAIHNKIRDLQNRSSTFWNNLKSGTRKKFLAGKVCNKKVYITNIEAAFKSVIQSHLTPKLQ